MRDLIKQIIKEYTETLNETKWTEDILRQEASKYKTMHDFITNNKRALDAAYSKGKDFFKDITSHMVRQKKWTDDELKKEASNYSSITEFKQKNPNAYMAAYRNGKPFLKSITSHMKRPSRKRVPDTKEVVKLDVPDTKEVIKLNIPDDLFLRRRMSDIDEFVKNALLSVNSHDYNFHDYVDEIIWQVNDSFGNLKGDEREKIMDYVRENYLQEIEKQYLKRRN